MMAAAGAHTRPPEVSLICCLTCGFPSGIAFVTGATRAMLGGGASALLRSVGSWPHVLMTVLC